MAFFSDGAGNGFAFCVPKVDVSGFDRWITLGGTQKGNTPTDDEIALSRINAWLLYWKIFEINAEGDFNGTPISDNANVNDDLVEGVATPEEKICPSAPGGSDYGTSIYVGPTGFGTELSAIFFGTELSTADPAGGIVRMYNGTTNESNFVGYGIHSEMSAAFSFSPNPSGLFYALVGPPEGFIYVCSYGDDVAPTSGTDTDFAYTSIKASGNDMPVLCGVYALGDNPVADALNLKSSFENTSAGQTFEITLKLAGGADVLGFWA